MEQPKRQFFPLEFKCEAVAQVEASGRSVGAIATELGLCDTVLRVNSRAILAHAQV